MKLLKSTNHADWTGSEKINDHLMRIFERVNRNMTLNFAEELVTAFLEKEQRNYDRSCEKTLRSDTEKARLLDQGISYTDLEIARAVISGWLFMAHKAYEIKREAA